MNTVSRFGEDAFSRREALSQSCAPSTASAECVSARTAAAPLSAAVDGRQTTAVVVRLPLALTRTSSREQFHARWVILRADVFGDRRPPGRPR